MLPFPLAPTSDPYVFPSAIPSSSSSNILISSCSICNTQPFNFRTLSLTFLYSGHINFPLQTITNINLKINIWTHKLWHLITPNIKSILNYYYIFQNPPAYSSKQDSTQQPNLNHCYFTPLSHLLLNITSSYTLPITSLKSTKEATVDPSYNRPKGIYSFRPVLSPMLTPIKITTYDQITVLPTQLYTSIYFLFFVKPQIPYITLWFPTPSMTQAYSPIHSSKKWLESNIFQYWRSIHIHYLNHSRTYPSLSKLLESNISYLPG